MPREHTVQIQQQFRLKDFSISAQGECLFKNISKINYENFTFNFLLKASSLIFSLLFYTGENNRFVYYLKQKSKPSGFTFKFWGIFFNFVQVKILSWSQL